jgi:hypothetical protein
VVTFADLREQQQEAKQTVDLVLVLMPLCLIFIVGFQLVWLFYIGGNMLNFKYCTPITCEFICDLFIFYYLNTFK